MASFLQIGRMFYKGITISQTKETAQHILDSVSADLQYANTLSSSPLPADPSSPYKYICVGNSRYTYMMNHVIDASQDNWNDSQTKSFGLIHDSGGCAAPFTGNSLSTLQTNPAAPLRNPVEMLGNKMRLSDFSISQVATNLYNVNVYIAYGDDDVLNGLPATPNTAAAPTCVSDLKSSEFCSITSLKTAISKNFGF
jgi:hypothetical protein